MASSHPCRISPTTVVRTKRWDDFTHLWVGQAERLACRERQVSGQKPGPTLRPGAEDREKKSGSVDHRDCDAVDKEKSPCVKWSENKYENSPCLAVCTVVCLDYGRGRVPTPPRQAQANVGRCSRPFWTGGFLPPGPFSEDEKYSRIKAGVADGSFSQSQLPAVRAVTGIFTWL